MKHKILVVSYALPFRNTGTPVVVRTFLENFNNDEVVLMGRPVKKKERVLDYRPHYPMYLIPTPPVEARGEKLWRFLSVILGTILGLYLVLKFKPTEILAFYRDESSLLTGYIVNRITGVPLYSYFCDLYIENYSKGWYGILAKWLQPKIFEHSNRIFVLTEGIKEYYLQRYGIQSEVIPHCINEPIEHKPVSTNLTLPLKIGYLGSINIDRTSSLRLLSTAIENNEKYQLQYYTSTPEGVLREAGLLIPNSIVKHIPDDAQLKEEIEKCDILFLPQTITKKEDPRWFQLLTGLPTKTLKYLISGKPILVHSHLEYFLTKFIREYHCGYVIQAGKAEILLALEQLSSDDNLRKKLSEGCVNACKYFTGSLVATRFLNAIDGTQDLSCAK